MALDLAINVNTGDLIFSPNRDLQYAQGDQIIRQRIHARLMIAKPWALDPTGGELGSRIYSFLRSTTDKAKTQLRTAVMEALAPIDEISVETVDVSTPDQRTVRIAIQYVMLDVDLEVTQTDVQTIVVDANV